MTKHSAARTNDGFRPMAFEVGKRWPMGAVPSMGNRLTFSGEVGPMLNVGMDRPTAQEVLGVRRAPTNLALVPAGKHTLFLLVHNAVLFGGDGWTDAPFCWSFVPADLRHLPDGRSSGSATNRYLMLTFLTDEGGIVRAMRSESWTPEFSDAFDALLAQQERHADAFTPSAHEAEIRAAYARYREPSDMLPDAVARCRAGA